MILLLLKKYKEIGWDVSKWKWRKGQFRNKMEYDLNKLMISNWILGRLNVGGHKSWSFYILKRILMFMKSMITRKEPILGLGMLLNKLKQNVLLFNKRKGSVVFELPRFLTIEQSIKKVIEWMVKVAVKNKENIVKSLAKELVNLYIKKGEVLKKKQHINEMLVKNKPFFYLLKRKKRK